MNKRIIFSLLVILAVTLTACGGSATTAAPVPTPTPSSGESTTPQKGGEIVVVYKDDLATLDPAIGYDWTNWPVIKMVFDGLLD